MGKKSERVFGLAKLLQGSVQASKSVCLSLLFTGGQGQRKLSLLELNKGTLVYSQTEGQGLLGKPLTMIIIIKASQRNSFQHGVRIGFLLAIILKRTETK